MRLREYSENIPKPLVNVGSRPILWHVMRYYAHYGHKDFILCLGWKGDAIRDYFTNYQLNSTGGVLPAIGGNGDANHSDVPDWRITFVDTGLDANVGQRLLASRPHLEGESIFLANYADGLSNVPLPRLVKQFHVHEATAAFVAVHPQQSWHVVQIDDGGIVEDVVPISDSSTWMNGGYFVLRDKIFDFLEDGEELVVQPFQRLIARRELFAMKYNGFWSCMDTFKDKQRLEDMVARGETPWEVWKHSAADELDAQAAALDLVRSRPR